jgi:uncharacterized membrane protein
MRKDLKQPVPQTQSHTVESVVAIAKHPIHPMLVTFPIAFLSVVVVTDLLFLWLRAPFWAELSFWLNVAGLAMGLIAGVFGTIDMMSIRVVRRHVSAWNHFIVAVMVLAMAALGVWLRLPDHVAAVWPWGLLSSSMMAVLVGVAGWLGGTLSFRHGVGVYGDEDPELAEGTDSKPPAE